MHDSNPGPMALASNALATELIFNLIGSYNMLENINVCVSEICL